MLMVTILLHISYPLIIYLVFTLLIYPSPLKTQTNPYYLCYMDQVLSLAIISTPHQIFAIFQDFSLLLMNLNHPNLQFYPCCNQVNQLILSLDPYIPPILAI